jgi:hypothetical protein
VLFRKVQGILRQLLGRSAQKTHLTPPDTQDKSLFNGMYACVCIILSTPPSAPHKHTLQVHYSSLTGPVPVACVCCPCCHSV